MTRRLALVLVLAFVGAVSPGDAGAANPDGPDVNIPVAEGRETDAPATDRGVVWTPPEATADGLQALDAMARRGVTAVRLTRPTYDPAILARADTLGLRLYVDLPTAYASAGRLQRRAAALADTLDRLVDLAARHPSVYAVGIAPLVDTSAPETCAPLRALADRVRDRRSEGSRSLITYAVTPFRAATDRCATVADWVLLDLRDATDPAARWRDWQAAADRPVGVGALGTWTRPERAPGLRVPHSPEWQARRIEQGLSAFLTPDASQAPVASATGDSSAGHAAADSAETPPPAVFVYRWTDRPREGRRAAPLARHYGLFDTAGSPRPAARVVTGFYTGRQQVFAFPNGRPPTTEWSWLIALGWVVIGVVAVLMAQTPLVRRTAARYFRAHGFYRDSVREGRETLPEFNAVLLLVVAAALGIVTSASVRAVDALPSTTLVLEALPPVLSTTLGAWVQTPGVVGVGAGIGSLALLGVWTLLLTLAAREWGGLGLDQTLMLVTWACWPAVPAMIVALVSATQPPAAAAQVAGGLLLAGGLVSAGVVVRVLRDYVAVSKVPGGIATALAAVSPPALVVAAGTLIVFRFDVSLRFLWHLVSRT